MPRNPAWWKDPQRRQLQRRILRQQQAELAARGMHLTWKETAEGVELYLDGLYDSTITLEELRAGEQLWMQLAEAQPALDEQALIDETIRRLMGKEKPDATL